MTDKTLEYIDFLRLLEVLQTYSSTQFISERISSLRPVSSLEEIAGRQDRVEAVLEITKWYGPIPLKEIPDIKEKLWRLTLEESVLEASDFLVLAHFLAGCKGAVGFLKKALKRPPYIESIIEGIRLAPEVAARIRKTVNEEGFIEDSASYELSKIRSDL